MSTPGSPPLNPDYEPRFPPSRTAYTLDHGCVALIDALGDDQRICEAARVLPGAPWRELDDPKLIRYMYEHGHTSPFEHVVFTFYVKAPIFVFRQWHRHRTWSFNEISARYKELPAEYYVPRVEHIGKQSVTNHQSRILGGSPTNPTAIALRSMNADQCEGAFEMYRALLEEGCPRELARCVLPMNTYSEMYATVDLHNLMHFLKLRLDDHAQYEIRVYARALRDLAHFVVPLTMDLFSEHQNG